MKETEPKFVGIGSGGREVYVSYVLEPPEVYEGRMRKIAKLYMDHLAKQEAKNELLRNAPVNGTSRADARLRSRVPSSSSDAISSSLGLRI